MSQPTRPDKSREITGVILAGGPSSRFAGLPKGLQTVGGERIIDRIARPLGSVATRLLIISNDAGAGLWLPNVAAQPDVLPLQASVVGIYSAIAQAGGDVIVVAWDMPFVQQALLEELRDRLVDGVMAVVPWSAKGPEPVCAAYSVNALLHLEGLARGGAVKLSAMVAALPRVVRIPVDEVKRFGDPATMFFNVNSAEDQQRAEGMAAQL